MEPLTADDPQMIGEFRLHARLGAGGMGQVYLGFSPAGRPVAIKVVHSQFAQDQEFLQRFSREVAAAGAVSGMYTAPVVGSGLSDRPPWLATAYVPGPPLATVVGRYGSLPLAAVWRLAAGLAEALRAVHAAGLVHRDLKPANVLLADDGPHVIDFGISRAFQGTQLTSAGMVIGTPGYMSPEQAEGTASGPPSDIFSLGCVLAYSVTGSAPFGEGSAATILYRVVRSEPDLSTIPPPMRQLIEGCLKKNPAERPDPGQLISQIAQFGPATTATLGSFWPEEVARVIAAERVSATPAGLTPPGAMSAPGPVSFAAGAGRSGPSALAGAASGASGASGLAGDGRTPTALATGSTGQPLPAPGAGALAGSGAGPGTGNQGSTGAGAGNQAGTGHAPMISDGYYAAAAQGRPSAPGPVIPPVSPVPQSYAGQPGQQPFAQPYTPPPSGQVPLGPTSPGQGGFGQASFGQPGLGQPGAGPTAGGSATPYPSYGGPQTPGSWQPGGGGAPWPGAAAPGMPGGPQSLPGYTQGRRNPMTNEVPPVVRTALRIMYAGFAVTVLDIVVSMLAVGRFDNMAGQDTIFGYSAAASKASMTAGLLDFGIFTAFAGLVCWIVIAVAARRGRGWCRVTASVILGLYTVCMLLVVFGTSGDPGPRLTTLLVWLAGIAALVPLWTQQARQFFRTWRRQ